MCQVQPNQRESHSWKLNKFKIKLIIYPGCYVYILFKVIDLEICTSQLKTSSILNALKNKCLINLPWFCSILNTTMFHFPKKLNPKKSIQRHEEQKEYCDIVNLLTRSSENKKWKSQLVLLCCTCQQQSILVYNNKPHSPNLAIMNMCE